MSRQQLLFLCLALLGFSAVSAKFYFKEEFLDDSWETKWVKSKSKEADGTQGKWAITAGKWYSDAKKDKGLQTSEDARFYGIAAPLDEEFNTTDQVFVLQYQVKHPQSIDCGGGYLKVLPANVGDLEKFDGSTEYKVMFGPDICGYDTKKTHVIINYKNDNKLVKKDIKCETDQLSHLYTLAIFPNNTYEVYIDLKRVENGSLYEDWDFLPAKTIKDPNDKKPADWVDDPKMPDPEDKKPADWDDEPELVKDPEAKKPEDWDDESDGEWEAPMIENPKYKGKWEPKLVDNPAYKGEWVQKDIPNPDFQDDPFLYRFENLKYVAFDLWQVKAGTIFDNIIVTDSLQEAKDYAKKTFKKMVDKEKKMFDEEEKKRQKEEEEKRKKDEEEDKKKKKDDDVEDVSGADDDDDDDDDDDEEDKPAVKKIEKITKEEAEKAETKEEKKEEKDEKEKKAKKEEKDEELKDEL